MKRSYSLIFMTDQGKTSRMRVGSGGLRFIIILCVALPLLLGGSLWAGWELLQRYTSLRAENAALRAKLTEQDDLIARLGNLEQFLRASDPELLRRVLGPAYADGMNVEAPAAGATEPEEKTEENASPPASADSLPASVPPPDVPAAPEPQATPDKPATSPPSSPAAPQGPKEGESVKPNLPPHPETPPETAATSQPASIAENSTQLDKGLAEIKNMKARRVGTRNLRISLDLYNTTQGKQLAGKVDFELVLADGSVHPLTGGGDTSYRINRLKKIISNPTLPADVNVDGASVRAKVYADDELIYSGSIPLQQ